jgi:misacylated tRNA(Ala) deacylase
MSTELLFLRDSYLRSFESRVVGVEDGQIALAETAFYPTGGGQPHDLGSLDVNRRRAEVTEVSKEGTTVWHTIDGAMPTVGDTVVGEIDWDRRHRLMRTHTALHVLGGVIWNEWRSPATGGNMKPLEARMDFQFDPLPDGFAAMVEERTNEALRADLPIVVDFLPRDTAVEDEDLIRTKVNLIPESVAEIRVVDIVGLDKQADGGTHVASTAEVGAVRVLKTKSKGKGNKRLTIAVVDAD